MSADRATPWRRRAVLASGVLLAAAWAKGVPSLALLGAPDPTFRDLPDLPPFRALVSDGAMSAGMDAAGPALLTGLPGAAPVNPALSDLRQRVRDDPWIALYGTAQSPAVPVAVFSDVRCPNCRVMETRLSEVVAADPAGVRIVRHELPVFGAASVTAARALLAADLQDAAQDLRDRLIRTPAVTDTAYVVEVAAQTGLDPDRLRRDMASARITAMLQHSRAVADVFGFIGTPAFGVGRTVFMGTVPTSMLRALVSDRSAADSKTAAPRAAACRVSGACL
jgi:protein-disulfide isomerase